MQSNALVEYLYQVIYNMIVTKYLDENVFDYIYPRGETLTYIAWDIWAYYHSNSEAKIGQYFFGKVMILKIMAVVDWRVITANKTATSGH